jgi:O-antigen/teichoic acid export membrane protein
MRRAWAALERVLPRLVLAITGVVVAAVTSPSEVGLYAWGVIFLTLVQAATDLPARQVAVNALATADGRGFLHLYSRLVGTVGPIFLSISLTILVALASSPFAFSQLVALLPLALVPLPMALAVLPVASLQRQGHWRSISSTRAVSSVLGTAVGVTVAISTKSIAGASLANLVSEATFAIAIIWLHRRHTLPLPAPGGDSTSTETARAFRHMAIYSLLGWAQAQSDRVLVGALAGPASLGNYTTGMSIGRSAGDAVAASQASVLRVDLGAAEATDSARIRALVGRNLRGSLFAAIATFALTTLGALLIVAPILGPEWAPALSVVPIVALTGIPAAISWSSGAVHVFTGRTAAANIAPAVGIAFAPVIAIAATSSLTLAAWLVVLRETLLASCQILLMRRAAPLRAAAWSFATLLFLSLAVLLMSQYPVY